MDAPEAQSTVAARPALKGPRRRSASASAPCRNLDCSPSSPGLSPLCSQHLIMTCVCSLGCLHVGMCVFFWLRIFRWSVNLFWRVWLFFVKAAIAWGFVSVAVVWWSGAVRWSIWTHLTLRDKHSQTEVIVEVMVLLAFWIIGCLLDTCLRFKFFFLEIVASWHYLLSVFSLGALFFYGGVLEMCVCAFYSTNMVSCVLPPWLGHVHFCLWGGVWQSWRLFISFCFEFAVHFEHVCVSWKFALRSL